MGIKLEVTNKSIPIEEKLDNEFDLDNFKNEKIGGEIKVDNGTDDETDTVIEFINVSKFYQEFEALKNVSFKVKKGQIFGFLGPNGSGKTSTIKLILDLMGFSSGKVNVLEEVSETELSSEKIRLNIGSLLEFNGLIDTLTGLENLIFWGGLYNIKKNKSILKANELLYLFKLNEWADTKVSKYSYGMKKRLGLARSLISNPELIILDEPTLGVDPESRQLIRQILVELSNDGKTIFFSSHDLAEVQKICSHLAVIKNGEIKFSGNLNDFLVKYGKSETYITMSSDDEAKNLLEVLKIDFNVKRDGNLIKLEDNKNFKLGNYSNYDIESVYKNKSSLEDSYFKINENNESSY
jgi:ABC-2 type transport system ATP-binding protein